MTISPIPVLARFPLSHFIDRAVSVVFDAMTVTQWWPETKFVPDAVREKENPFQFVVVCVASMRGVAKVKRSRAARVLCLARPVKLIITPFVISPVILGSGAVPFYSGLIDIGAEPVRSMDSLSQPPLKGVGFA